MNLHWQWVPEYLEVVICYNYNQSFLGWLLVTYQNLKVGYNFLNQAVITEDGRTYLEDMFAGEWESDIFINQNFDRSWN